jgi:hypothetical protein
MEDILEVYALPPEEEGDVVLVCMDEQPVQLLEGRYEAIEMKPGSPKKEDFQYIRKGVCSIFMFTAPHLGWRHVDALEHRTKVDWAHQIDYLVNTVFADKRKIRLVLDNLNVHTLGAFYEAFDPVKARAIVERLELHFTPKHGSWLNVAEIELAAMTRQCLSRRIGDLGVLRGELFAWEVSRNANSKTVNWHFTTENARGKLRFLYPKI